MKKLSIVILNFNTKELTKRCLESIGKYAHEVDLETIVIDNASSDGSVDEIKSFYPKVKIIENKENVGFAKGNNSAKNLVGGKYVLFLNSDTGA